MHIHAPLKFLQKLYKQMPVDSWHLRKAPEISAKSTISIGYTKHISEHLSLLHYSVRKFKYLHEFLLPPVIFIKVSYIWGDIFYYSWFLFADLNSCQCFCLSEFWLSSFLTQNTTEKPLDYRMKNNLFFHETKLWRHEAIPFVIFPNLYHSQL